MDKLRNSFVALGLILALAGCSKKAAEPSAESAAAATGEAVAAKPLAKPGRESIPGENSVREALAQKQYSSAVERFTALKAAVATPEQNDSYMSLYGEMRSELEDAARTDPKAAEALGLFRALRNGR